jgi:SAM-dependent methyltransferase
LAATFSTVENEAKDAMTAGLPAQDEAYEVEAAACPLGCTGGQREILVGKDRLHGLPGAFPIVECATCGLWRTSPRPTRRSIGSYYPDDYQPYVYTREGAQAAQTTYRPLWRRVLKPILDTRSMYIPRLRPGAALEIGCASGAYLTYLKTFGWTVKGIEPNATAAENCRKMGFDVTHGTLEDVELTPQTYDLIVGWMVVEHLFEPVKGLRRLLEAAKPGATICLSMPNIESIEYDLFHERWFPLSLPTHLFHFSPRTIEMVLKEAGWRDIEVFPHRSLATAASSLAHVLADRGHARLSRFVMDKSHSQSFVYGTAPVAHLVAALGKASAMTVWAKR